MTIELRDLNLPSEQNAVKKDKDHLELLKYHIDIAAEELWQHWQEQDEWMRLEDLIENCQNRLLGSVLRVIQKDIKK